ncbi:RNA-binding protein 28 isoform X3 [Zootermopsis nevadensis]|uniref:RNA-binding protein 28 n=1 Tax=Zootermopsis nevadensis TaxID=136037 RepID=A0A067RIQ3_ZOONE|nr:RNA-binding protein 28 isoform X3 [Zootermopsis nevadensis]KDR23731.1 RNA-binding protein 28 [Zootermopsis nevadensis]
MPHKGKKRFRNKETTVISVIRNKKRRVKLKLKNKKGAVIIKNLSFKATEDGIREYFNKFGDICELKLLQKLNGDLVGRGIIQFRKEKNAAKAIQSCNGKDFMERKLVVDWAQPRLKKENGAATLLKVNEEAEERNESEHAEESSDIKNENKLKVLGKELVHNAETKECKKSKKAKKGRLIVRNLPFKVTEEVLRKHFEKYGEVTEVNLLRKSDGKLVGCGFIQFVKKNSAAKAILSCSGKPLMGRTIIVDWAVPKSTFSTTESSAIEEIEIKEEDQDDDGSVKKLTSGDSSCDVQPVEIKNEPLSDESEDDDNADSKSDTNESSDSDEEEEEEDGSDQSDIESKQKVDAKKPRVVSNDVSEGRTVFIKNVPFSADNSDLKTCVEQFGQVIYALVCTDPITEHSKGTAFVKFQTKESAQQCLAAGTELTLLGQTLDVHEALNKEQIQQKADLKHGVQKSKDGRNLYLVKEGVVIAGSKAAGGVSMADMEKRLQLEQWKSQMLRNLSMFVSRFRLVVHNLPPSWDDSKLRHLFLQHAGPKAVIKEARVMRDMKNVDAQGIGNSKEFGFVSFTTHEDALQALRSINNNPNIFTPARRPIVAFSVENKAIMNIKQKRLEKSRAKNPLYTGQNIVKRGNKRTNSSRDDENSAQSRAENGKIVTEETEQFLGVTAKPGSKKLRTRFGLKSQAEIHKQSIHKDKRKQKQKRMFDQQMRNTKEKRKDPQPRRGVKRKPDEDDAVFSSLVSQYKKKLMAVPVKKWYDE